MLLVFTFVALWHDLSLHLLAWGWLITLFVLPETMAVKLVPEGKVSSPITFTDSPISADRIMISVRRTTLVQASSSLRRSLQYLHDDNRQYHRLRAGSR